MYEPSSIFIKLLYLAFLLILAVNRSQAVESITIDILGQPFSNYYSDISMRYAQNIWDMKLFNGKIYLGAGNSSNKGPAVNAGPVPIISYNPLSNSFNQEGKVDDEQIDRFVILNGILYIPGHDPKQDWKFGNYYYEKDNQWFKIRRIPNGLHMYDLTAFDHALFAALGTENGGAISQSDDNGEHWKNISFTAHSVNSFMQLNGKLYAIVTNKINDALDGDLVMDYSHHEFHPRRDLTPSVFFPGIALRNSESVKVVQSQQVNGKVIYIGAYKHNAIQMEPFGLFIASSLEQGRVKILVVSLPDGFQPWDLVIRPDYIYLLGNRISQNGSVAQVFRSTFQQPEQFKPLFSLKIASGFVRSFEEYAGSFYLGIGSEIVDRNNFSVSDISPMTGILFRVRR